MFEVETFAGKKGEESIVNHFLLKNYERANFCV